MTAEHGLMFVDANILVYAHDTSAGEKHERSKSLIEDFWRRSSGCLSIQVLQEFYTAVTRKLLQPLNPDVARQIVQDLARWMVHIPDIDDLLGASSMHQLHVISFWNAMIVRSAARMGCAAILTEGMNEGQMIDGVRIQNPF